MTLARYKGVIAENSREIVIRKSRFIGHAAPVADEAEANAFIERVRKRHSMATHNCYAYVVGDRNEIQKFSDDGEPGGTAGRPILEVLLQRGLRYTAIVVTRYFGGIKLGAGGLVCAYTDGAVAALEAAGQAEYVLHQEVIVEVDYSWHGKVEYELRQRQTIVGQTEFREEICIPCFPEASQADSFIAMVMDLTQGTAGIKKGGMKYIPHESGNR